MIDRFKLWISYFKIFKWITIFWNRFSHHPKKLPLSIFFAASLPTLVMPFVFTTTHMSWTFFLLSFPFLSLLLCNSIKLLSPRLRKPPHVAIDVKITIKISLQQQYTIMQEMCEEFKIKMGVLHRIAPFIWFYV